MIKEFAHIPIPKNCLPLLFRPETDIRCDLQNIEVRSEYLSKAMLEVPTLLALGSRH
jgi:hypothetical protein